MPDEKTPDSEAKAQPEEGNAQAKPRQEAGKDQRRKPPLADKLEAPEAEFTVLVSSIATQVYVSLGLIENPISKKKEADLETAKFSIDMLQMLSDKTRGNLTDAEKRYLEGLLYDLRMRFIEGKK